MIHFSLNDIFDEEELRYTNALRYGITYNTETIRNRANFTNNELDLVFYTLPIQDLNSFTSFLIVNKTTDNAIVYTSSTNYSHAFIHSENTIQLTSTSSNISTKYDVLHSRYFESKNMGLIIVRQIK